MARAIYDYRAVASLAFLWHLIAPNSFCCIPSCIGAGASDRYNLNRELVLDYYGPWGRSMLPVRLAESRPSDGASYFSREKGLTPYPITALHYKKRVFVFEQDV